jgi:hypothetical protein
MRTLLTNNTYLLLVPVVLLASALTHLDGFPGEPAAADEPVDGALTKIRSFPTSEHGVPRPSAMALTPTESPES